MQIKELFCALKDFLDKTPVYIGIPFEDKYIALHDIVLEVELDSPSLFIVIGSKVRKVCEYRPSKVLRAICDV